MFLRESSLIQPYGFGIGRAGDNKGLVDDFDCLISGGDVRWRASSGNSPASTKSFSSRNGTGGEGTFFFSSCAGDEADNKKFLRAGSDGLLLLGAKLAILCKTTVNNSREDSSCGTIFFLFIAEA